MKFYLLSDNIDTQMGMRLVGIERVATHECHEVLEELERVMYTENITITLIATKLIGTYPEVVSKLKLKQKKPLIAETPSRYGFAEIGETIGYYVPEAIDVKL